MHKCIKQNMPTICFLLGLTPELTAYCFLEPCQFCPPSAYCPVTARRRVTRHYQPSQRGPTKSGLPSGGLPLCGLTLAESFSSPPNRLLIPEPVAPRTCRDPAMGRKLMNMLEVLRRLVFLDGNHRTKSLRRAEKASFHRLEAGDGGHGGHGRDRRGKIGRPVTDVLSRSV